RSSWRFRREASPRRDAKQTVLERKLHRGVTMTASTGSSSSLRSGGISDTDLVDDLVAANRILFDQGVVDGFGHVSARSDRNRARFLLSRSMAPGLVTADDIMEFDDDGQPLEPRGRTV